MGCGASSNDLTSATTHVDPPAVISNIQLSNPTKQSSNVLIVSHSSQATVAEQLKKSLLDQQLSCQLLDENKPKSLVARASLIQRCDVVVIIINRVYQRTSFCMEALIYAKDMHKPLISILSDPTFRPYGALGAIAASVIRSFVLDDNISLIHMSSDITKTVHECISKKTATENIVDPSQMNDTIDVNTKLQSDSLTSAILICTTDDGHDVAELISEHLIANQVTVSIENLSKSDVSSSVRNCTVFVPILTPQLEQSTLCQFAFEQARLHCKPVVPVMAVKKWRPRGWLGLVIAGRVFFRIFDRESAYQSFYDSNRMTDLRVAIENACLPTPTENQREEVETKVLEKEIDDLKNKLLTWPPERKSRVINATEARQAVRVEIPEPQAQGYFEHTHHSVTRLTFHAPPAILDQYGLPKRRSLDCMISYQWDKQEFVRQIYEDLHMRTLQTWFDIWSFMQGDTYNAMATGVECAKVLLVFLSKEYIRSTNCQLEFRYAVQRGKAFVILRTESNLQLEQWMLEAIQGFPQYDVYSYEVLERLINGVPLIDVITQAIRTLVQAQPSDPIDDCSPELFQLRSLVDDARDALSKQTGIQRYKTCTRCGQQYDDYSNDGCKKHSAYFMGGGGLLEDQWVCCRQQKFDSPGCRPCEHIDQERVFVEDPHYGTSTWKPA